MPRLSSSIPKYRKHRASGQAIVTLSGTDHYLGPHGTAASKREYDRLVGEWQANGRSPLPCGDGVPLDLVIVELFARYWEYAKGYYVKDGRPTDEQGALLLAMRPLRKLFGEIPARQFTPLKLEAVRNAMIEMDWCRKYINASVDRIRRMFRWAVAKELLNETVYRALTALPGLKAGRCNARESLPVRPVPQAHIESILPLVSPQVQAMIEIQLLTGMRPGEVVIMRGCDLDMSGKCWMYIPERHKTEHMGRERQIHIGPKAQEIIKEYLKPELSAHLFTPSDAEAIRNQKRRAGRQTPMTPSQAKRRPKKHPQRPKGEQYTVASYRRAIRRACERADKLAHKNDPKIPGETVVVPQWHPNQLRHNAATRLRKEFGIEVARVILGHHSALVTEIYAEQDRTVAADIMAKVG